MRNRLMIVVALLMGLVITASAQPANRQSVEETIAQLTEKLDLTPEQVTAITPIIEEHRENMKKITTEMERGPEMKKTMQNEQKEYTAELEKILTEEQFKTFQEMQKKRAGRSRRPSRRN